MPSNHLQHVASLSPFGVTHAALWLLLLTSLLFVGSIALAGFIIVQIPEDYLTRDKSVEHPYFKNRPLLRIAARIIKNLVGLLMMIAGGIMLITPGQGILFILMGLMLSDFPGKRQLARKILQKETLLEMLNSVREKANKPPLQPPP